jgi:hypothetical protein
MFLIYFTQRLCKCFETVPRLELCQDSGGGGQNARSHITPLQFYWQSMPRNLQGELLLQQ